MGARTLRGDLLAPTLQFFGAIMPLLLVALVISRADTGVAALKKRTETLLLEVVPSTLARFVENETGFYPPARARAVRGTSLSLVWSNFTAQECASEYIIAAPFAADQWVLVVVRLEVNVRRVNFNLCVPDGLIDPDSLRFPDVILRAFPHTTGGAQAKQISVSRIDPQTSYEFHSRPISRTVSGIRLTSIVASKFVGQDFLWDAAEQLYFSQDLLFMLRAFVAEAPHMFVGLRQARAPGLDDVLSALAGGGRAST